MTDSGASGSASEETGRWLELTGVNSVRFVTYGYGQGTNKVRGYVQTWNV